MRLRVRVGRARVRAGREAAGARRVRRAGIAFPHLFRLCRERFLVGNELGLRAHLTEFRDHALLQTRCARRAPGRRRRAEQGACESFRSRALLQPRRAARPAGWARCGRRECGARRAEPAAALAAARAAAPLPRVPARPALLRQRAANAARQRGPCSAAAGSGQGAQPGHMCPQRARRLLRARRLPRSSGPTQTRQLFVLGVGRVGYGRPCGHSLP